MWSSDGLDQLDSGRRARLRQGGHVRHKPARPLHQAAGASITSEARSAISSQLLTARLRSSAVPFNARPVRGNRGAPVVSNEVDDRNILGNEKLGDADRVQDVA
jgi:hypothetical protein